MNIKQEIVDSIQIIVDAAIRKICPIITFGVVTSIYEKNKCSVKINDIDYKVTYYGKTIPDLMQKYPVFVPFGKMNMAFIMTDGMGEVGDYNSLENRPSINNVLLSGNKSLSDLQINRIYVGECLTSGNISEKIITIDASQNFALETGSIIAIKYSASNSASNVTLNINDSGAKQIWYSGSAYTGNAQSVTGYANRYTFYVYDGTYWVWITYGVYPTNTVPASYCSTGASTAAKTATHTSYVATANTYTFVTIATANTSKTALTLNINGRGAKPIYINGTASSSTNYTLPAGTYIVYYDGNNYHFRTDGQIPNASTVRSIDRINSEYEVVSFSLSESDGSIISTKTPFELAMMFDNDILLLSKLYNTDNSCETLEKIFCNDNTIIFSTSYQDIFNGDVVYRKRIIGDTINNTWTYEFS